MLRLLQPPDGVSMQIQVKLNVRYNPELFYCPTVVKNGMLVIGEHQDKICPLFGFVKLQLIFKISEGLFITDINMNFLKNGIRGNQIGTGLDTEGVINAIGNF
jgi:hypothetical protein